MDQVWEIMARHLTFIWHAFDARIISFVLMANHWHMLLRTPLANISEILWYFMTNTSRDLTAAGNRINQTYGGRSYKCVITDFHYFQCAYKYIYYNPVKAGICANVEDYKYSSLAGLLGNQRQLFPVEEDITLFSDVAGTLNWLNAKPTDSDWKAVQNALHKPTFALAKDPNTKKAHRLESLLL